MTDPQSLIKIEAFIRTIVQPDVEEWEAFTKIVQFKKLKKKDLLLEEGQVCNFIAFLNSGVLREYSYQNGKDRQGERLPEKAIAELLSTGEISRHLKKSRKIY